MLGLNKICPAVTAAIMFLSSVFGIGGNAPEQFVPEPSECKNVILMIGDGMGYNSIEKTRSDLGVTLEGFDKLEQNGIRGESKTASANFCITDSAAGGSAIACATRINNNTVGVYPSDKNAKKSYPMNMTELATSEGKLAGVITTDGVDGATPASFTAHSRSREHSSDIIKQQINNLENNENLRLIWGRSVSASTSVTIVNNKEQMDALREGSTSYGLFTDVLWHETAKPGMPTLAEMTDKAIDLLDDDDDGFFLMVEAAHIDKNNHDWSGDDMEDALQAFDDAIEVALKYADEHDDTLIIVTADHETGGIIKIGNKYIYSIPGHTSANVPIFVYGPQETMSGFMASGEVMENRELSRRIALSMGVSDFPRKIVVPAA